MFSINLYLAIALIIIFFTVYPAYILIFLSNKTKRLSIVSKASFILYLCLLVVLVFGDVSIKNNTFNVQMIFDVPWFTMNFCIASFSKSNVLYNLIMMFPVSALIFANSGLLLKPEKEFYKGQKIVFLKTILLSFIISILIEIFQFVLPVSRTTEVLDLILNTISGAVGYVFFFFVVLVCKKMRKGK